MSGGIGRIAYVSRFGPAVLPVNYKVQDGAIVFRTAENGPLDEDIESWAPGDRELFVRIVPSQVTGGRVGPA